MYLPVLADSDSWCTHARTRMGVVPRRKPGSRIVMDDLRFTTRPIDDLFDLVDGARFVLLGEATHGTHEFYAVRAELTKRLVAERGFRGVAVEADWPVAARVNRYIQG